MRPETFAALEESARKCREAERALEDARAERDARIVRAVRGGDGLRAIARVTGLSAGTVQRIRDRAER